jgi:hypothetical protein
MPKEIYIVKGSSTEDYNAFRIRMYSVAGEIEKQLKPATLKLNITLKAPPRISVIPFSRQKAAAFSVTGNMTASGTIFSSIMGFTGAYRVEEALPVAYEKSWDDGTPTPGVCMLTLFRRKPGLDDETFISRWHHGHTPLSLRLHPLWNYNRNVVTGSYPENLLHYEGIVEEQFRKPADLLNPFRFFGPALKTPYHMWQVYRDSRSFIDMKRMEIYLTNEIHLKS